MLVIDTFEEIQQRSRALVQEIFEFLEELQHLLPSLELCWRDETPSPDCDGSLWSWVSSIWIAPTGFWKRLASRLKARAKHWSEYFAEIH